MTEPAEPRLAVREALLETTAELIGRAGVERFMQQPVQPGAEMFPDQWARTRYGVSVLARRLALHAGLDHAIEHKERKASTPPTERKPATRIECIEVTRDAARFARGFLGTDDIVGTLAHELGVAFAVLHRNDKDGPYRSQEPELLEPDTHDSKRGSIATVYLGLDVLAANATPSSCASVPTMSSVPRNPSANRAASRVTSMHSMRVAGLRSGGGAPALRSSISLARSRPACSASRRASTDTP